MRLVLPLCKGVSLKTHQNSKRTFIFVDKDGNAVANKIRRSGRNEVFSTTGSQKELPCALWRIRDGIGNLVSEVYCPVARALHQQLPVKMRMVRFHACISESGETFIYPQKLDPPGMPANSWNESLDKALSSHPREWITLWSDSEVQSYQYEPVRSDSQARIEYPDFEKDLSEALEPNFINDVNHPIVRELQGQRRRRDDREEY